VGPAEADILKGLISLESPLGAALMKRKAGDTVTFETPAGRRSAEIVSVS
jgi:transcription elongation factor GreA